MSSSLKKDDYRLSQIFGGSACPAHRDMSFLMAHWKDSRAKRTAERNPIKTLYVYDPNTSAFVPADEIVMFKPGKNIFQVNEMDLLLLDDDEDEVIRRADKILETDPDNESALIYKAIALSRNGDLHQAIALNRRVLEINPANTSAHHNLAMELAEAGDFNLALHHINLSINLGSDFAPAHTHKAHILIQLGRHDEAYKSFEHALRNPSQTLTLTDTALYAAHIMGFETVKEALEFIEYRKTHPHLTLGDYHEDRAPTLG
jgi:tetratricopeptide (TPR) repeat protein